MYVDIVISNVYNLNKHFFFFLSFSFQGTSKTSRNHACKTTQYCKHQHRAIAIKQVQPTEPRPFMTSQDHPLPTKPAEKRRELPRLVKTSQKHPETG